MGGPCPCHWCTNGLTLVWLSDVPHRPLLLYDYELKNIFVMATILFAGAYGCILDLYLFRGIYYYYILVLGDWTCVQYTSFTAWELATPSLGGIPSHYTWYPEVSPSDTWLLDILDLTWYLTWLGLVVDNWLDHYTFIPYTFTTLKQVPLTSFVLPLCSTLSFVCLIFIILYCLLLSYLFTGLS